MIKKMLCGEKILEVLFVRSGMTFDELTSYFFHGPLEWGCHMTLINCLRELCDAALLSIDSVKDDEIREFISYCEYANTWNNFHGTEMGPSVNRFRVADGWRVIRGALVEGLQYTSYHRVVCFPTFGKPSENFENLTSDVFVAMPFKPDMAPAYSMICDAARALNLTVKRADEFSSSNPIVNDIWSAIWNSKCVIADCTGRNPNVFYEIGIAHTIGMPVILIAQDKDDIPFDVRHIRYMEYQITDVGREDFANQLQSTLRNCLRHYD